jgi:16S rRNA (cytosine967-C5)-methyltransferase
MSRGANQGRVLITLLEAVVPHLRTDRALPERIQRLLAADRRLGSRDRRLYRELLYTAIRHWPSLEPLDPSGRLEVLSAWCASGPATEAFRLAHVPGSGIGPPPVSLPEWFRTECPEAFEPALGARLMERPPLWIRVRASREDAVAADLALAGLVPERSDLVGGAWRLPSEARVDATPSFEKGDLEIQDIGSQALLQALTPEPGGLWLDACAGAGGKTLQLADLLGPEGRIEVRDPRAEALDELAARARRAGVFDRIRRGQPGGAVFDGVLVDAPCSGTGTWRRNPHAKWSTTPAHVERAAEVQTRILDAVCQEVKPGGVLAYATCSLCRSENEAVAAAFVARHPEFQVRDLRPQVVLEPTGPGWRASPLRLNGDAFFLAAFTRQG